jgi:hypothetical protein
MILYGYLCHGLKTWTDLSLKMLADNDGPEISRVCSLYNSISSNQTALSFITIGKYQMIILMQLEAGNSPATSDCLPSNQISRVAVSFETSRLVKLSHPSYLHRTCFLDEALPIEYMQCTLLGFNRTSASENSPSAIYFWDTYFILYWSSCFL